MRLALLAGLAVALLAGCDGGVGEFEIDSANSALCHDDTYEDAPTDANTLPPRPAAVDTHVVHWHCGGVLGPSNVVPIFWGSTWKAGARPLAESVLKFLGAFGGSHYTDVVHEYAGTDESNNLIHASGELTLKSPIFDTAPLPGNGGDDSSDLATALEVCRLLDNHTDDTSIYLVFDERAFFGTTDGAYGHHSGSYYCPDHPQSVLTATIINTAGLDYSLPDWNPQPHGVASIANTTAHELIESITNPRLHGWYNRGPTTDTVEPDGGTVEVTQINEIADKCQFTYERPVSLTDGTRWALQMNWSNRAYRADGGEQVDVLGPGCLQE